MQRRHAGSSLRALLLLVALSATCVGSLFGSTHALALERRALEQPLFTSLQAADLMAVGATSLSLAPQPELAGVHQDVTTVVNLSGRMLPVSVSMEGIAGLTASVEPGILAPGQMGTIRLDGPVPAGSGTVTGILHLYGFNQYVHFAIPVSVAAMVCGGGSTPLAEGETALSEAEGSSASEVPIPQPGAVLTDGCGGLTPDTLGAVAPPEAEAAIGEAVATPSAEAAIGEAGASPSAEAVTSDPGALPAVAPAPLVEAAPPMSDSTVPVPAPASTT
ncbi:MAG TPA: hypothetical protein VK191_10155 [Symbiobacteriaceae bacterium]|nr:hypothetical protein [Symbiobacteriaceae bacterium]